MSLKTESRPRLGADRAAADPVHTGLPPLVGVAVYQLPSTSPAHASWSFERKLAAGRDVFVASGIGCRA